MYAQLEEAAAIQQLRLARWQEYCEQLEPLAAQGRIELPHIPADCTNNAHMFYIKTSDITERGRLITFLKERDILAVFHYIPLHTAPAGLRYGRFHGEDRHTTRESERLLRLPMAQQLTAGQVNYITDQIKKFYDQGI
jgi:dTDP-4-amino-4,6-dideoxygalactose transaminase